MYSPHSRKNSTLPSAVIFDLDGCLVDSEPISIRAITGEIREMGVEDVTFEYIRERFLGVSMAVICEHVTKLTGIECSNEFIDRVELRLFDQYRADLRKVAGVTSLLKRLRTLGIPVAIATGGSILRMHTTLEISKLASWFSGTAFSADQVENGKPAPDLFIFAAENLGIDPKLCVVVEDSPHGIEGAIAAGMRTIGFIGGSHLDGIRDAHAAKLVSQGADIVATEIGEIARALLGDKADWPRGWVG